MELNVQEIINKAAEILAVQLSEMAVKVRDNPPPAGCVLYLTTNMVAPLSEDGYIDGAQCQVSIKAAGSLTEKEVEMLVELVANCMTGDVEPLNKEKQ